MMLIINKEKKGNPNKTSLQNEYFNSIKID